jgi:hypothetical protein
MEKIKFSSRQVGLLYQVSKQRAHFIYRDTSTDRNPFVSTFIFMICKTLLSNRAEDHVRTVHARSSHFAFNCSHDLFRHFLHNLCAIFTARMKLDCRQEGGLSLFVSAIKNPALADAGS